MLIKYIAWYLLGGDASFLHMALSSDPQFYWTHCAGLALIEHCNYNGMDQIVVP